MDLLNHKYAGHKDFGHSFSNTELLLTFKVII